MHRGWKVLDLSTPFVKSLFSGKAIATQIHPRNEDTIVATQQPFKPVRASSTRRKGTIKHMNTVNEATIEEKEDEPPTTGWPGEFSRRWTRFLKPSMRRKCGLFSALT
jgi:hypothetical protein